MANVGISTFVLPLCFFGVDVGSKKIDPLSRPCHVHNAGFQLKVILFSKTRLSFELPSYPDPFQLFTTSNFKPHIFRLGLGGIIQLPSSKRDH
jgi:hypothetical protein